MVKKYLIVAFLIFTNHLIADAPTAEYVELPYLVVEKPAAASEKNRVLVKAQEYLGTSYGFGNSSGIQTDCSGFTQQVFKEFGVSLPRSAAEQSKYGSKVDINNLEVGDLLFYRTYKKEPSHVAIYAGDGQIIHASYRNKQVQYDAIDKAYYKKRFIYAKRLTIDDQNLSSDYCLKN
jgi:cell wall-associated NlpC family hydrolase